jgi:hypothetical protein
MKGSGLSTEGLVGFCIVGFRVKGLGFRVKGSGLSTEGYGLNPKP